MSTQLFSNNATLEILDPDSLTLHPVVFMFPELNPTDFDALVNSVRAHGQIDPVWITNDNQIIDGRHRWRAQKKLGQQVQCRRLKNFAPELLTSIIDHCIAQNINRRHMNKDQRAVVAASMEKKRIEAVSAQERGELSLDGGTGFSWSTFEELLQTFRIPKTHYERANRIVKWGDPKLVEACANGTISIAAADHAAKKSGSLGQNDVSACLRAKDPESAVITLSRRRLKQSREIEFKAAMEDTSRLRVALRVLKEMTTAHQAWRIRANESMVDATDFSVVNKQSCPDIDQKICDFKTTIRVFQKLVRKLEADPD